MNATAVLCARHGKATGAGTQRRQRIQQFVTSPRDSTDIADRGKTTVFHIFCSFSMSPPSSVSFSPAYILVSLFSPSSPLFSHAVLFIRPFIFQRVERKQISK